jgi:hypothetical protein
MHIQLRTLATTARAAAVRARDWRIPAGYPAPQPLTAPLDEPGPSTPPPPPAPLRARRGPAAPTPAEHAAHARTLRERFPKSEADGVSWAPPRRLSRQAMDGVRALHAHDPAQFSTPALAARFKVSAEAVRRILRSRWAPPADVAQRLAQRDKDARDAWIAKRRADELLLRKQSRLERDPTDRLALR